MEGSGQQVALAGGNDSAVGQAGQGLGFGADALDKRRADEDGVDRFSPGPRTADRLRSSRAGGQRRCGGRSGPSGRCGHRARRRRCRARGGSCRRRCPTPACRSRLLRGSVVRGRRQPAACRWWCFRRPARSGRPDPRDPEAFGLRQRCIESRGAAQHGRVLGEVALNGEDADGQRHQPRVAIWFASPSVRAEMPTIGSPRPRETSTRMDGS